MKGLIIVLLSVVFLSGCIDRRDNNSIETKVRYTCALVSDEYDYLWKATYIYNDEYIITFSCRYKKDIRYDQYYMRYNTRLELFTDPKRFEPDDVKKILEKIDD